MAIAKSRLQTRQFLNSIFSLLASTRETTSVSILDQLRDLVFLFLLLHFHPFRDRRFRISKQADSEEVETTRRRKSI